MSPQNTLLACISGQNVTLAPPVAGGDVERLLHEATGHLPVLPGSNIDVLTLNRSKLLHLARRLEYPPKYNIKVNGNTTAFKIEQYHLIYYPVIIFKVIDEKVKMHGIKDGQVPLRGNKVDWEKIRKGNYEWDLRPGKN